MSHRSRNWLQLLTSVAVLLLAELTVTRSTAQKIVVTNDDGWAVAQIRLEYEQLQAAGYDATVSAPAENGSGSGSLSVPALPLLFEPCEYNSCPIGSPAEGFNASNPRLNYINALPVDAARYGIQTLAPQFFNGAAPDLVVSGPNVGANLGIQVEFSGTIGAACEAVKDGVPSVAFSGADGSTAEESWMNIYTAPSSRTIVNATSYAQLTATFLAALFTQPPSTPTLLPSGVILNVNFPAVSPTCSRKDVQWVLTRVYPTLFFHDVVVCNNGGKLPEESSVIATGCFATVSIVDADTKLDADANAQGDVLERLVKLGFVCA
ncbi:hypothetical protein NM688_g1447 [Phlebia brevispora]|uniref:Uncharacterized protein n=1 Tax=Phlebia brevispora TaxID=194682 RepID=A0ACC1TB44_9APHY|nr:hypothetical protein NM688_g1447 [Phlebia brevispora]